MEPSILLIYMCKYQCLAERKVKMLPKQHNNLIYHNLEIPPRSDFGTV